MNESAASSAASVLREHRSRIIAGLLAAGLFSLALFGGHSFALLLALGPAIVGGLAAALQSAAVNRWVDSRDQQFQRVTAWAEGRSGKVAHYFAGPAGAASAWLWARTQTVSDPSTRAGIRLALALYLWAIMVALLAAVAYVVIAIVVLVLIVGLISWVMSLGSGSTSSSSSTYASRSHAGDDKVLSAAGRRGQRFYQKEGLLSESEAGRVDSEGHIYRKTGVFSEDEVGRVDESGRVHEKTGLFSEEESHRVHEDGRIFKKTGLFAEEEVGRVAPDGRVFKKTGLFSEEESGRVEDA